MSAAENLTPTPDEEAWTPSAKESEVDRARREDPAFPVDLAKAIAKARGETYNPVRHGPFEAKRLPRKERGKKAEVEDTEGPLADVIERFMSRGVRPPYRHLRRIK